MRHRFSISDAAWERACEYARLTNRTPSELVCEALDQIMARYPKTPRVHDDELSRLALQVAALLGLQVPAGTSGAKCKAAS